MRKLLILWVTCLAGIAAVAQDKFTLNGYIKDSLSGETLIGASLSVRPESKNVLSNQYGFYSITVKKGTITIACSFVGYQTREFELTLDDNRQQNILLLPNTSQINNVTVYGRRRDNNIKTAQMGKFELSINTAKALPAFLGEAHVLCVD
eukprot:Opistho-1_new@75579